MNEVFHFPVLKNEIIQIMSSYLDRNVNRNIVFVDCTVGLGGHTIAILHTFKSKSAKVNPVIIFDKDDKSLDIALKNIKEIFYQDFNIKSFNLPFSQIGEALKEFEYILKTSLLIALADLGISYYQLKNGEGFSFNIESFLDMRYDRKFPLRAYDVVNNFSEKELTDIFDIVFKNRKFSGKIASRIVKYRKTRQIKTTFELNKVISKTVKDRYLKDTLQKVYLSLRIFVNKEIEELNKLLNFFENYDYPYLLLVITYHSLEGKAIKNFVKRNRLEFNKVKPSRGEIEVNKPSRSAILWVILNERKEF